MGLWDYGTLGLWDTRTLGLWDNCPIVQSSNRPIVLSSYGTREQRDYFPDSFSTDLMRPCILENVALNC